MHFIREMMSNEYGGKKKQTNDNAKMNCSNGIFWVAILLHKWSVIDVERTSCIVNIPIFVNYY